MVLNRFSLVNWGSAPRRESNAWSNLSSILQRRFASMCRQPLWAAVAVLIGMYLVVVALSFH